MRQDGPLEVPSHRPLRHLLDLQSLSHTGFAGKESWVVFRVSQSESRGWDATGIIWGNQKPSLAYTRVWKMRSRKAAVLPRRTIFSGLVSRQRRRQAPFAVSKSKTTPGGLLPVAAQNTPVTSIVRSRSIQAGSSTLVSGPQRFGSHQACVSSTLKIVVVGSKATTTRLGLRCSAGAAMGCWSRGIPASIIPVFPFPSAVGRLQSSS